VEVKKQILDRHLPNPDIEVVDTGSNKTEESIIKLSKFISEIVSSKKI
jgi:hypothetical protein